MALLLLMLPSGGGSSTARVLASALREKGFGTVGGGRRGEGKGKAGLGGSLAYWTGVTEKEEGPGCNPVDY